MATNEQRITLERLRSMVGRGERISMLTAYDYLMAVAAEAAGVEMLLVGDSVGTVLLGHETTQKTPFEFLVYLTEAVRRGAPRTFLVGDLPYETLVGGVERTVADSRRFRDACGCDAVKLEVAAGDEEKIRRLSDEGLNPIAHLGLRPQTVTEPSGYRAQARTDEDIRVLVEGCRGVEAAGAVMVLLEAVPNEAAAAVVEAVDVPVIGCGAGPACHGHVVVTEDMLGRTPIKPPRFVPVLADLKGETERAIRRYVEEIRAGRYPGAAHVYGIKRSPQASGRS